MINWNDIDLKNKTSGEVHTVCPNCSHTRKKKKDPCLSVNLDKGMGYCHHCNETTFKEEIKKEVQKEYLLPPQEWSNHTALSDKLVKWFKDRGISQKTLIECKITEEKHYQPKAKAEVNNIVFNYFEGSRLINKKYRSGSKHFTQSKGTKNIFYGINDIIDSNECYIVEGEMDKLTFWEAGIKNCISVPNGANDSDDYFENNEQIIKSIDKFYIAVDTDEKGILLEKELVKRLGKHKCFRVNFKNKDANEDWTESPDIFKKSLDNISDYPIDGTYTANDIKDEIFDFFDNPNDDVITPRSKYFNSFNDTFKLLLGQLTVVTGVPSHGKSSFIEWMLLNYCVFNKSKLSFFSPEHFPMKRHHSKLAQSIIGKPFRDNKYTKEKITKPELERYIEWSKDRIYLTMPENGKTPGWEWLMNKFEEQIYRYGIDFFVVDAWNKVRLSDNSLTGIQNVLSDICIFCQTHNVNIFLIAHPTKMPKRQDGTFEIPTLYDVKGSGDFYDQTHNGITVYRDKMKGVTTVHPTKLKFEDIQGSTGNFHTFTFDYTCGRFHSEGCEWDRSNLLDQIDNDQTKEQEQIDYNKFKPLESAEVDFENDTAPF